MEQKPNNKDVICLNMPGTQVSDWQAKPTVQTCDHKKATILIYPPHNQDIKCNNLGRSKNKERWW